MTKMRHLPLNLNSCPITELHLFVYNLRSTEFSLGEGEVAKGKKPHYEAAFA